MTERRVERRLAAVLAADVVGYSRLMGADEAGTRARFNDQLDEEVRPAIDEHRGRLVKTMGDGFLVEFPSVVEAVQCAELDHLHGAGERVDDLRHQVGAGRLAEREECDPVEHGAHDTGVNGLLHRPGPGYRRRHVVAEPAR